MIKQKQRRKFMKNHEKSIMTKEEALRSLEEVFVIYTECLSRSRVARSCNLSTINSKKIDEALSLKHPEGFVSILQYNHLLEKYSHNDIFKISFESRFNRGFSSLLESKRKAIISSIISKTPLEDSEKLISDSLWENDRDKEVFLASFLAYCYTDEFSYNDREKKFYLDLLVYCLDNLNVCHTKPFISRDIKKTIKNYLGRYSGDIKNISPNNKKSLEAFLKGIDDRTALHVLKNKDSYFKRWRDSKPNEDIDKIKIFCEYCIDNKGDLEINEINSLYNTLKRWNERSYYPSQSLLDSQYILLAILKPQELVSRAKNKMTGVKKEERSAIFTSLIKAGLLNPKTARKMRSESSSEISKRCILTIFDNRESYKNSVELVSQFLDSKYQEVIFVIFNRGSVDDLMGLIGNGSISQDKLFEKINLLKHTKSEV